jgi:small-conductance mechanosensitive channel
MFSEFSETLDYQFLDNTLFQYLIAIAIFFIALIVLRFFKMAVIHRLKALAQKSRTDIDDLAIGIIENIGWFFYVYASFYLAHFFLSLPDTVGKIISYLFFVFVVYYAVKSAEGMIDYMGKKVIAKKTEGEKETDAAALRLLIKAVKGVFWGLAIIIILQNLGYNVSALVAGLGVSGVAIAFALQNVLSDIFASFSIYLDKPFQIGDFIIVGEDMGIVKRIGVKSTRIQTLQGEELVVCNKELTESRVHNYKKMQRRRIVFGFGVEYETPTEKLKRIVEIVKEIIGEIEITELDRVHFKEFGEFSLVFEVVYYLNSSDYTVYMDTQQEINLQLKEQLEEEGVKMAYPTQTIFVKK